MMLYGLGSPGDALRLFQQSRRLYGDHAVTFWNMALCHTALDDAQEAAFCLAEAKRFDPGFAPVAAVQVKPQS
jgi:tetratricopeptide (TPR) repeat protein